MDSKREAAATNLHPARWIAIEVGQGGSHDNPVPVYEIETADGHERIAEALHENDAKRICLAVNSHDALVAALAELVDAARACEGPLLTPAFNAQVRRYFTATDNARAALAKALASSPEAAQ